MPFLPDFSRDASQPLPGGDLGASTIRLAAGRPAGAFHLTFEREEEGAYYSYYDGLGWSAPERMTGEAPPYRGGMAVAVDSRNRAHLAWGSEEDGGERRLWYRSVEAGVAGPVERVQAGADHPECDLAVDGEDRVFLAGTTDSTVGIGLHRRDAAGNWSSTLAPTPTERGCWAPAVGCAPDGRVYLAYRNRENDSPTYWNVWHEGRWTEFRYVPGHKFQPYAIMAGAAFLLTANAHQAAHFMRIEPDGTGDYAVFTTPIAPRLGRLRGAHVGLARTARGTLVASHSTVEYKDTLTRTVRPGDRFVLHVSEDDGRHWGPEARVTPDIAGQGFGAVSANGDRLLAVWPDLRGGRPHLRYRLWRDV